MFPCYKYYMGYEAQESPSPVALAQQHMCCTTHRDMQPLRHHLSLCARGCQLVIQLSALGGQLVRKGLPLLRAVHRAVEPRLPVCLTRLCGRLGTRT